MPLGQPKNSQRSSVSGGQTSARSSVSFGGETVAPAAKSSGKYSKPSVPGQSSSRGSQDGGKKSSRTGSDPPERSVSSHYDESNAPTNAVTSSKGSRPGEGIYNRKRQRIQKFSMTNPLGWMEPQSRLIFWYILFLSFFSIAVFSGRPAPTSFFMLKTFQDKFLTTRTVDMQTWEEIRDIEGLWSWIRGPLFEILYEDNTPGSKEGALFGYDYIVNGVRVRQVRIQPEICDSNLPLWAVEAFDLAEAFGPRCYNALRGLSQVIMGSNEDKESFGGEGADGEPVFKWSEAPDWSTWYISELASYPPGGFNMDLPAYNVTKAQEIFDLHVRNRFLDLQTRGVFIDLTTYNANMNELLILRLLAEQSEFGGVVPSSSFFSMRVKIYDGIWGQIQMVCEGLFAAVLAKYLLEEIGWLITLRAKFLYRFQGMFIVTISSLMIAIGVFRLAHVTAMANQQFIGEADVSSQSSAVHTSFQPTDNLMLYVVMEESILAVMAVLIYARFFILLAFSMVLKHIYNMLRSALFEILPFLVLFFIIFVGFSLGFYVVFGTAVAEYRTFARTLITNVKMISGEPTPYEEIYAANRLMAPLLYYSLFAVQFVILFNVFMAILVHTYAVYKNELEHDPEDQMKDIIYASVAWFLSLFGIKLEPTRRKVAPEKEQAKEEEEEEEQTPQDADATKSSHDMPMMMDDVMLGGSSNPPVGAFAGGAIGGGGAQVGVSPELEGQLKELIKRSNAVDGLRTELLSVSDRINALTEYILAEPTSKIQKQVQLVNRKLDLLAEALIASQAAKGNPSGEDPERMTIPGWTE